MNEVGILVTLQARHGKEAEVEQFLKSSRPLVAAEVGTTAWFFDTFKDGQGRSAHVSGEVAKALLRPRRRAVCHQAQIEMVDILAQNNFERRRRH